jgi:arylsulfatase A-like enzyme
VLGKAGYTSYMVLDTPHIIANGYGYDRGFSGWKWIRGQEGDRYKTDPLQVKLPCAVEKLRGADRTTSQYLRNVHDRKSEADYFAPLTMADACDWLDRNHTRDKFFLYVDTFDPHEPWDPPKKYADMYDPGYDGEEVIYPLYAPCAFLSDPEMAHIKALYAGEVTMVDAWVGKLLAKIEDLGLFGNTLVIFTTDHGFYFGEHGVVGKFGMLYDEMNHIPLIMHMPGAKPGRRSQFVQPCDHMPTILDLAGIEHPAPIQGKSLVDILKNNGKPVRDCAVNSWAVIHPPATETPVTLNASNWDQYCRRLKPSTLITDQWTLITSAGDMLSELYNNAADPGQTKNVIKQNPAAAKDLHAKYISLLESLGTDEKFIAPRRKLV